MKKNRNMLVSRRGFTLVEILVSMVILTLLLLILTSITDSTRKTWTYTTGKIEQFRDAREAFESVTRQLGQATLNTYWDYQYDSAGNPLKYIRQSELRFISGPAGVLVGGTNHPTHSIFFQAPLGYVSAQTNQGLDNLLNTWGYFVEYADDSSFRPAFLNSLSPAPALRKRFRLMEVLEPSETLVLYNLTNGKPAYNGTEWFTNALAKTPRPARVLADNIIALILLPQLSSREDPTGIALAPGYSYDSTSTGQATVSKAYNSKNQLPPVVQVTMVAMDEVSANRLSDADYTALQSKLGTLFSDAAKLQSDLAIDSSDAGESLEEYLVAKRIVYRVFTTNVAIKGAKWSREQIN